MSATRWWCLKPLAAGVSLPSQDRRIRWKKSRRSREAWLHLWRRDATLKLGLFNLVDILEDIGDPWNNYSKCVTQEAKNTILPCSLIYLQFFYSNVIKDVLSTYHFPCFRIIGLLINIYSFYHCIHCGVRCCESDRDGTSDMKCVRRGQLPAK